MVTQYDERGKIFTQVIAKQPIQVTIQTGQQIIKGLIHVRKGQRIKDELNGPEHFLAVTDAVILDHEQKELYQTSLLIVNMDQIVWVLPQEEV